jgi:hypothetical protein
MERRSNRLPTRGKPGRNYLRNDLGLEPTLYMNEQRVPHSASPKSYNNIPQRIHLIRASTIGTVLILFNQRSIFGHGQKPSPGIIGVFII